MERVAPSRVRYLSVVAVLLIWAQGVYFSLADQAFAQDITTSLPRFALFVTGHGLVVLLIIGVLLWLSRETLGDLGFTSRELAQQLGIGALFGCGLFILHQVVAPIIDAILPTSSSQGVDLSLLFGDVRQYPLWIFLVVFKGGLAEEGMRIFGLTRFEKVLGRPGLVIAAVIGSVVFGVAHLYQGVDSAIATGLQAVLFVLIYLRKRKALEVVTAHAVYDIIGITIAYWIY
jgi:membrane protease YdiL (CAAX protease family)